MPTNNWGIPTGGMTPQPTFTGGSTGPQNPLAAPTANPYPAQGKPPANSASASPNNPPNGPYDVIPEPSDDLRRLLNAQNWKVPAAAGSAGTPAQLFNEAERKDLAAFDYTLSADQWKLVQDIYGSEKALQLGYLPPSNPPGTAPSSTPLMRTEGFQSAPLTWDAYNALSADQKAAVDFNTLLLDAREKDVSDIVVMTPEEQANYKATVERIFGPRGGSNKLAPNVVGLLSDLDFQAVGQDLDEYLSLDRAITAEELGSFKIDTKELKNLTDLASNIAPAFPQQVEEYQRAYTEVNNPANVAKQESLLVEKSKASIEQAMQNAANAIWSFQTATAGDQTFTSEETPLGYGTVGLRGQDTAMAQMDSWLQGTYNWLSTAPDANVADVEADMADGHFTPEERQYFFDYVDNRTKLERQYGGPTTGPNARKPDDIRKLVGLGD